MKLYYVEYNPYDDTPYLGPESEVYAHYLEVTDLGTIIEHGVQTDDNVKIDSRVVYSNWKEYYDSFAGGKEDFQKRGHMVRIL